MLSRQALASLLFAAAIQAPASADPPSFPLKLSADGKLLVDQQDRPFLIQGDSPWSLIVQLTLEEAETYLEDRREKGFNLVMVNLIEHAFCDDPPNNRYGQGPFFVEDDFSTPNEAYFAHADAVIDLAAQKGIVVLLAPAYLGYGGGNEGWYQEMLANGATVLRDYGRYVGQRYVDFDNIIWLNGGDYSPPAQGRTLVNAIAEGILEFDTRHLHTAHCSPEDSPLDIYPGAVWLDLNNTYSYWPALYESVLYDYNRADVRPFFMLESAYEDDFLGAPPARTRRQAWWSNLSGAGGQLYGNNPIWFFGSGWQAALDSPGTENMRHVGDLFNTLAWWTLVPDQAHDYIVAGYGTSGNTNYITAAANDSGSLMVAYVPPTGSPSRSFTLDLSAFSAPVYLQWYDPTGGGHTMHAGSPFSPVGTLQVAVPGWNDASEDDWALLAWTTPPCDMPADLDCDCYLTAADLALFTEKMAGPGVAAVLDGCRAPAPDANGDGDVDVVDYAHFQIN